jgi:hypothetical protein
MNRFRNAQEIQEKVRLMKQLEESIMSEFNVISILVEQLQESFLGLTAPRFFEEYEHAKAIIRIWENTSSEMISQVKDASQSIERS